MDGRKGTDTTQAPRADACGTNRDHAATPESGAARHIEPAAETRPPSARPRRRGFHRAAPTRKPPRPPAELAAPGQTAPNLPVDGRDAAARNRRLLAEVCKVVGAHLSGMENRGEELNLPRRLHQTLQGLTRGDSEKQIARALGISQHTVHVYVKQLYKRLGVSSRAELMARFMRGI